MATAEQKLREITDIVKEQIETINGELSKPAGLTNDRRMELIRNLRLLHWFMELLTTKDQVIVPRKEDKSADDLRKLLDKMTPPPRPKPNPTPQYPDWLPPTSPDNPFAPQRRKKDEPRDPLDDIWRGDPTDWTYDPFKRRKNKGFRFMCNSGQPVPNSRASLELQRPSWMLEKD